MSAFGNAHLPGKYSRNHCDHGSIAQFRPYSSRTRLDEEIEDEGVPFDIAAAAEAGGNAKRQLINFTIRCLILFA